MKDESGQSIIETALIFPLLLLLILGLMQIALMNNAKAITNYAAFCAARAGIVYEDESERKEKMREAAVIACAPISANIVDTDIGVEAFDNCTDLVQRKVVSELTTKVRSWASGDILSVEVIHHFPLLVPFANKLFAYTPIPYLSKQDVFGLYELDPLKGKALPSDVESWGFEQIFKNPHIPIKGMCEMRIEIM